MDDREVVLRGSQLSGKKIDFIVSGGIACIESPRWIRELRRYGAEVRVILTPGAQKFISTIPFEWASKQPVLTELGGGAEHLSAADAIVIAPATLDFISKVSYGFGDTAAATAVQSRLGKKPILFFPSMHLQLQSNPLLQENISRLQKIEKVYFLSGRVDEGKEKALDPETAVLQVCHLLSKAPGSKRVLLTVGGTREAIDDVRFIGNRSSGRTGWTLATHLYRDGHDVEVIQGVGEVSGTEGIRTYQVESADQMRQALDQAVRSFQPEAIIFAAAVLDFKPASLEEKKTSSQTPWNLSLQPAAKIMDSFLSPTRFNIGFKLESRLSKDELKKRVELWAGERPLDLVVSNLLRDVRPETYEAMIFKRSNRSWESVSSREELSEFISRYLSTSTKV